MDSKKEVTVTVTVAVTRAVGSDKCIRPVAACGMCFLCPKKRPQYSARLNEWWTNGDDDDSTEVRSWMQNKVLVLKNNRAGVSYHVSNLVSLVDLGPAMDTIDP